MGRHAHDYTLFFIHTQIFAITNAPNRLLISIDVHMYICEFVF